MIPLGPAIVYSIDTTDKEYEDPRTQGKQVPASVKWINDCLDVCDFLLKNEYSHPLEDILKKSHDFVCKSMRNKSDRFLCKSIELVSSGIDKENDKWTEIGEFPNVENWGEKEQKGLETVIYSLSILKACKSLEIKDSIAHAAIVIGTKIIDVVIVFGKTHSECLDHAKIKYVGDGRRFVLLVTRDSNNTLLHKKDKSILENIKEGIENYPDITDPYSGWRYCGYQNLVDGCFSSKELEELKGKITEVLGF
jgi:hypothetical protein